MCFITIILVAAEERQGRNGLAGKPLRNEVENN
jgi:hypothetical protein